MSLEKFDELFDKHYPKNGGLVREETRAKLREHTYQAVLESLSDINTARQGLKDLTPSEPEELYDSIRAICGLSIWQIEGMPMLYDTYQELTRPLRSALDGFYEACNERRGFLLRKNRPTPDELMLLREAALQATTVLEGWLGIINPAPVEQ